MDGAKPVRSPASIASRCRRCLPVCGKAISPWKASRSVN